MNRLIHIIYSLTAVLCLLSCQRELPQALSTEGLPALFPDYTGVTVPPNIAPLNFRTETSQPAIVLFSFDEQTLRVNASNGKFDIPAKKWKQLLQTAAGKTIQVTLYTKGSDGWLRFAPFDIQVTNEPIDPWLAYRRIAPGYRMWNEMGIYQRNLENFTEKTILKNTLTNNNCMNCHSFPIQDPGRMLFHQRALFGGTYMLTDGQISKLAPQSSDGAVPPLTYPYWHPSGRYVAFSSNDTHQDFHLSDANRIEVFDTASDIVFYDIEQNDIFSTPLLRSADHLETFPTFSPDGRRLFFCSAPAVPMPDNYREMKYNLLSIAFDPDTRTFGATVDTLYNATVEGRSAKFPRVSPDGRYLMYTLSDYGNFSIWHRDADLRMIDLTSGDDYPLTQANSDDVDSYHSWSSNSRWFVFSSRRIDGLYTRPYLCYLGADGQPSKPFVLPQEDPDYYTRSLFSFNIPELIRGEVPVDTYELVQFTRSQQ